jgi:hypothetical protein
MSYEWNIMKDSEKTKYNNLAAKDKKRYEKELKIYEMNKRNNIYNEESDENEDFEDFEEIEESEESDE